MSAMGGPVGGMAANTMNMGTPTGVGANGVDYIKRLNTAIYDYMLRNQLYDAARQFISGMEIETVMKKSPNQRGQVNGADDGMDIESKEIQNRPDDLPAPIQFGDGSFLQDWWCQFWEIFQGHRGKGKPSTLNYIGIQRQQQKQRTAMMGNGPTMDPATVQRMNAIQGMNGAMGVDLKRAVLQNSRMNPQAMAQFQNMKANQQNAMMPGAQMERQPSQMDMTGGRNGSPNTGGEAPSPKRQRIGDGNMQPNNGVRPGPPNPMQNNQGMPPNAAMNAAMGPGGQQGSPMAQPGGMDAVTGEFYANNPNRMAAMAANVAAGNQNAANNNNNGNHALQDYQMQLMLLEQQNKKRLLMARQEQDNMGHAGGPGPNGQFPAGMSPSGSRQGDPSPLPNAAAKGPKGGMSPNGDLTGRGSPQPGTMMPQNIPAELRQHMMANGQMMRPPSSHPPLPGGMTTDQLRQFHQQPQPQHPNQMMQNGWQAQQPHPVQMMGAGQPQGPVGQPNQGPPNMTPRQTNQMGPPPAPTTQPSSPAQPAAAPPTPVQTNKSKPGAKNEKSKKGANKKGANAPPQPGSDPQPPTPTPATPITPMNPLSFGGKANQHMTNGAGGSGQSVTTNNNHQNTVNAVQAPGQAPDMNAGPFGNLGDDNFSNMSVNLDFAELDGGDVLDNFDFDSFLNTGDADGTFQFETNQIFGDGSIEAGGNLGANPV